jgi:hypothetical protein
VPAKIMHDDPAACDVSATGTYYIIVDRSETPLAKKKLETILGRNGQRMKVDILLS